MTKRARKPSVIVVRAGDEIHITRKPAKRKPAKRKTARRKPAKRKTTRRKTKR